MNTVKIIRTFAVLAALAGVAVCDRAAACTGITLTSGDGAHVYARTIEWGGSDLNSRYVVVPRGYSQRSMLPDGTADGMEMKARYGYVGLAVEKPEFVAEGLNEKGLSAGLFYFPGYGRYETYNSALKATTVADLQFVAAVLGSCADVDDVRRFIGKVHVVGIVPQASTVHWRFADNTGKQIVLEYIDGKARIHDNLLGVLTNSPSFDWQMTNLNNYVNLHSGSAESHPFGAVTLSQFGAGSGMLGLPGDVTPPSRFVRAAFMQTSAPQYATAQQTVFEAFHILNNFDIPIGVEFASGQKPTDIPSATQWTSACDTRNLVVYYRTMYDSSIRSIDLGKIDFGRVTYRSAPLDATPTQPVVEITIR